MDTQLTPQAIASLALYLHDSTLLSVNSLVDAGFAPVDIFLV